jgi:gliding motility-associated protein GldL
MTIAELTQTHGWKAFMAKLYGWGASVVIIGALFKIMHWPFAGIMLICGLTTEAIIFFFSAFEPVHEELDWTLVYPELAGMTDDDEMEIYKGNIITSRGDVPLEKFENLVQPIPGVDNNTIAKFSEGLEKLNKTATDLGQISEVATATKHFANNFNTASQHLDSFANTYTENSEVLKNSAQALSSSYTKNAEMIGKVGTEVFEQVQKSGAHLTESYSKLSDSITSYTSTIGENSKAYGGQLGSMNKNLSELNTLYELQLKGTNEHIKGADKVYKDMDQMLDNLKLSVEETKRYKGELTKLSDSLASLNSIYGNMLSSMNVVKK